MIGKFDLIGLEFHAYHGVYEEEKLNGQLFIVDFSFEMNIEKAISTDQLTDTIDYTYIYELIKSQMNIRSALLEHVCYRIVHTIRENISDINNLEVKLTKANPPINGKIDGISLTLKV
jgi:dihydroneopterin aldolase